MKKKWMMLMDINLDIKDNEDKVKEAVKKVKNVKPEPSWKEVWKNIRSRNNSESDLRKLKQVKQAIDAGELSKGVDNLKKFSKAHALRLYRELKELRKDQYLQEIKNSVPDNYYLINSFDCFENLIEDLYFEDEFALDTETTGLLHTDVIVGLSFSISKDKHYYLPVRHNTGKQLEASYVFEQLKPILQSKSIKKILHNAKFDSHMLLKEGIDLQGISMDTMIAMHILNENEPTYSLKSLANKYGKSFGYEDDSWEFADLFGKDGKFSEVPLDIATYYACKDTHLTLMFARWIRTYFQNQPRLAKAYRIDNQTLEVAIALEREGVMIDKVYAENYKKELTEHTEQLKKEITEELEVENINSIHQIHKAMQEKGIIDDKTTSMDKHTLKRINHPVAKKLLDYRKDMKLLTTYIEPLPDMVRDTGRLHGQFNQTNTVTSRFASQHPNMQNLSEVARGMIIPKEGYMLVEIDYSQIEPRYLAHISKDKHLQEPYIKGEDLYSTLASKVFNKPIQECRDGSKYRKQMKLGLLACMYGISAKQLAESLGLTEEEANQFLNDFLESYPVTAKWMEEVRNQALNKGYVDIFGGRKRRFIRVGEENKKLNYLHKKLCELNDIPNFDFVWKLKKGHPYKKEYWDLYKKIGRVKRQAVNSVIQGSASTIMKLAMVNVYNQLYKNEAMVLVVHDAMVLELPLTTSIERIYELSKIMEKVVTLDVPLKVDVEISPERWNIKESIGVYYEK